ncbi:glyoxalase/bleomycin resistance/extradiol dioxygenase family protein [Novosphingobium sp. PC22D]|uniref:VOC family protein n=1 Tax=Novosphingobium sp. PC22D TaxID=1962403 RepID=UPI000BF19049|nr:VOC family protein [Novosphingobium sp. PC22D]PEQ14548.1 glyoxalase/bleomycin resistance/extradiol dioxygenase family protein [Novosphingobium sp. PC22D]
MQVKGIDHVNVLARDLDETARFYERVMGLERADNPAVGTSLRGAWMRDAQGHAIVHLVWKDPEADRYEGYEPGLSTNAVHHVAFQCDGFEAMRARLDDMGLPYRVNDLSHLGLKQIFVTDPNAVNLEFNFAV